MSLSRGSSRRRKFRKRGAWNCPGERQDYFPAALLKPVKYRQGDRGQYKRIQKLSNARRGDNYPHPLPRRVLQQIEGIARPSVGLQRSAGQHPRNDASGNRQKIYQDAEQHRNKSWHMKFGVFSAEKQEDQT